MLHVRFYLNIMGPAYTKHAYNNYYVVGGGGWINLVFIASVLKELLFFTGQGFTNKEYLKLFKTLYRRYG